MRILSLLVALFTFSHLHASAGEDKEPYGIHMMWLNSHPTSFPLIFPDGKKSEVLEVTHGWCEKNPEADTSIYFWYDGAFVLPGAPEATRTFLKEHISPDKGSRLHLMDMRSLDFVAQNPKMFESHIPVYFRTDILRFILGREAVANEKAPFFCKTFLYADLNVTPETRSVVFDDTTQKFLDTFGIVLLRNDQGPNSHPGGGPLGFENKFMMMRYNHNLVKTIDEFMLRFYKETVSFIGELIEDKSVYSGENPYHCLTQSVYDFIPPMFRYFYALNDQKKLFYSDFDFEEHTVMDLDAEPTYEFLGKKSWCMHIAKVAWRGEIVVWFHSFSDPSKKSLHKGTHGTKLFYKGPFTFERFMEEAPALIPLKRMTAPRSHFCS